MATFVKGDYVQVCPRRDWDWDQWSTAHTELCDKTGEVIEVKYEQWTDQTYIFVEHRSKRLWFLDKHVIKVENYQDISSEVTHAAVHHLNETEKICKRIRDEMLAEIFGAESVSEKEETPEQNEDELYDDWQEVTTKEVIPLPGNGGTMTSPTDTKAAADTNRKAIRKIKSLGKKITKKKTNPSGSVAADWSLSDEDMEELQSYIDALPYIDNLSSTGDIDFGYDFDNEPDYDGDGNGD